MALSNYDRIGNALNILRDGVAPFVEREFKSVHSDNWKEAIQQSIHSKSSIDLENGLESADIHFLLSAMWSNWRSVFERTLGRGERSLVSEIREWRNKWAHQEKFSADDVYRAIDSMTRLLFAISAEQAAQLDEMKHEVLRYRFDEQVRKKAKDAALTTVEFNNELKLKPWREIITPHPDVSSGTFQQAEFAADLNQVHNGKASSEYSDPSEFFQRTFITSGLDVLIRNAINRIVGRNGDPVVQLQTNFGGGKTHSMLALYHLFGTQTPSKLSGLEEILKTTEVTKFPKVNRAVFVGTAQSPANQRQKSDGCKIGTIWGEIAWQLGGKDGYSLVRESDEKGVSPGSDTLKELFSKYSPCLILIDEWVAFVRQLYGKDNLPGGSFDANVSFAQSLTEAIKQVPNALLVASIPASDIEIGGDGGREALSRLKHVFARVESTWRPATSEEAFKIVSRRLFEPLRGPDVFKERDAVIAATLKFYRENKTDFPAETNESDYKRLLTEAYPIHPVLYRQLYDRWSTLDTFQRTRGVLRLMSSVIHALWEGNDSSLFIMPAHIPLFDPKVMSELSSRHLTDGWNAVIESNIDGPNSLALKLDRKSPAFGKCSATRKIARCLFMGSAPTSTARNPGIDASEILLGTVQVGERIASYVDAIRHFTNASTHLQHDGTRYWFTTKTTIQKEAQDRAAQFERHQIIDEVNRRLRSQNRRGEFTAVHAAPAESSDVPDEWEARLVILPPELTHSKRSAESTARLKAGEFLQTRGQSPRIYKNSLVFLAADEARWNDLEQSVRQYLAWKSIDEDKDTLNLDRHQSRVTEKKLEESDSTVTLRVGETYSWLLVPASPRGGGVELDEIQLRGNEPLAERASRKLINDELLITEYSPRRLRMDLDKYFFESENSISVKRLWEAYASYCYFSRLKNKDVLLRAIKEGVSQTTWMDHFAYADGWDQSKKRFIGLKGGKIVEPNLDGESLLVHPDVAKEQLKGEGTIPAEDEGSLLTTMQYQTVPDSSEIISGLPRRFFGSIELDPQRVSRDAGRIADEVIRHLNSLDGAEVKVLLDIQVNVESGVPDNCVRTVSENCKALKFRAYGFEEN